MDLTEIRYKEMDRFMNRKQWRSLVSKAVNLLYESVMFDFATATSVQARMYGPTAER
jgi:hypothetical protein